MATFTQLPSGNWRAQVRRGATYKAATLPSKRAARDWATAIEAHAGHKLAGGLAPPPKGSTLADLIAKYLETRPIEPGRTKLATLLRLQRDIGAISLARLNANVLSEFIDRRIADKAGGVTIAGDLSTLQAVIDWAIHARQLDLPPRLGTDARRSLKHRQLDTRGRERSREPTEGELARLYAYWNGNERQVIDMPTLVRFALASGMRLGEACRIRIEDIDRKERTVVIRDRKDPRRKQGNDQIVPLLDDAWAIVAPLIRRRYEGRLFEVNAASASVAFTRACQALGIIDLHFHDLRHAATASFFRMGLQIPQVALLTGHKTWAMLKRYTDIKPEDVRAAIKPKAKERHSLRVVK
ncbi:MAG: site-specific integrase [Burkholderiaceae bacterium]|nr:site-specific integrase [Burkholderiaceae bacterium]